MKYVAAAFAIVACLAFAAYASDEGITQMLAKATSGAVETVFHP